ncbi:uncharacterized protein LOC122871972 isoform X2 [Siniperca chuatsi]|uniref:uncharacterized protein LOC122871972 isoform X2 n=1 Tax=Siniperca chuatsi TaxID=119488 RepID=UPI001CE0C68D|nr:uncharacterized protein LOC122871972 isoform X2 [Siniperca chuatsi]
MSGGAGRCADLRLEGAKTEEVAPMNGPTVNLHLLTVSHADTERDSENRGLPGGDREGGRLHRCGDVQDYTGQLFNMAAITEEGNINTCRYHEGSQLTHTNASTIIHIEDRTQILETSRQPSTTLNLRLLMNRPRPRAPFTFSLGAFISSLWVLDFKIHSVRIEPTTSEPPRSPLPPGDTEPGTSASGAAVFWTRKFEPDAARLLSYRVPFAVECLFCSGCWRRAGFEPRQVDLVSWRFSLFSFNSSFQNELRQMDRTQSLETSKQLSNTLRYWTGLSGFVS